MNLADSSLPSDPPPEEQPSASQDAEAEALREAAGPPLATPDTYAQALRTATRNIAAQGYAENIERFIRFRGTKEDEWVELQVLKVSVSERFQANFVAHVDSEPEIRAAFEEADQKLQGMGTFYVLNEVDPLVRLRAPVNQWNQVGRGEGTTDADIRARCAFFFDFDPKRPVKGISASDEESKHASNLAQVCYVQLATDLGSDEYVGYGFSGNGAQVYLALDHLSVDEETSAIIRGLLHAAKFLFSSPHVDFDTGVADPKRLCPAFGTVKRKGTDDDPQRPHRRTWFHCQENVRRLTQAQLNELLAKWVARLTPEQHAEVDRAMGKKPQAQPASAAATTQGTKPAGAGPALRTVGARQGPFPEANDVPVEEVADWLGVKDGDVVVCPGCGTRGTASDTSVKLVGNGLKCLHNRCADKPSPGRAGFRTIVDLVAEVRSVSPIEAVRLISAQFGTTPPGGFASFAKPTGGEEWGAPVLFDADAPLPLFPAVTLPPALRQWVEAEAMATQTAVDLAAMLVLAVIAAAVAKKVVVVVHDGWTEPANIYVLVALGVANRKSAVFRDVTRPLREHERVVAGKANLEIAKAIGAREIAKKQHEQAVKDAAKNGAGAAEIAEVERLSVEVEKNLPSIPRFIADDITTERVAVELAQQGGRLGVFSSEGGIFEIMAGRYNEKQANFDVYLKAHCGDDLRVDRIKRPSIHIPNPALTLGLTVQPEVVRGLADHPGFRGRGLLGRVLYSLPKSLVGSRDVRPPPVPASIAGTYQAAMQRMLDLTAPMDAHGEFIPSPIQVDRSALAMLEVFMEKLERELRPGGELHTVADWAGKLAGAVARIALLLHVVEHGTTGAISETTMTSAISIGQYLIAHAKAAFESMRTDRATADAAYLASWVMRSGATTFTKRDAFEGTKARFGSVSALTPALATLVDRGIIRRRQAGAKKNGRPSEVYEVNPRIASQYSQKSGAESMTATADPGAEADGGGSVPIEIVEEVL